MDSLSEYCANTKQVTLRVTPRSGSSSSVTSTDNVNSITGLIKLVSTTRLRLAQRRQIDSSIKQLSYQYAKVKLQIKNKWKKSGGTRRESINKLEVVPNVKTSSARISFTFSTKKRVEGQGETANGKTADEKKWSSSKIATAAT